MTGPIDPASAELRLRTGEFWTARQRQAASLHEVSYRGCFKPQLPRYFIERLSQPGDRVLDPFSGRGTTALEAGLLGRAIVANDVNPLSRILTAPRFFPPDLDAVAGRLDAVTDHLDAVAGRLDAVTEHLDAVAGRLDRMSASVADAAEADSDLDLSMFFHPETEREIRRLRAALGADPLDAWIRMVATNRLTGHSPGFFSVYSLPPNQAVTADRQRKINIRLNQTPPYRDTRKLILTKTRSLLRNLTHPQRDALRQAGESALFLTGDARHLPQIPNDSIALTVTSPPFLDVVNYASDNWLRCWFNAIDAAEIAAGLTVPRNLAAWSGVMGAVMAELYRVTRPGGHVAFEVGEVRGGKVRLEESAIPLGEAAGFTLTGVWINTQNFTKTSNIWGVTNNARGTNTNRVIVLQKP